jgi:hypothetical protein
MIGVEGDCARVGVAGGGVVNTTEQCRTIREGKERTKRKVEGRALQKSGGRFSTLGSSKSGEVVADAIDISRAAAKSGPALAGDPCRLSRRELWRSASLRISFHFATTSQRTTSPPR